MTNIISNIKRVKDEVRKDKDKNEKDTIIAVAEVSRKKLTKPPINQNFPCENKQEINF